MKQPSLRIVALLIVVFVNGALLSYYHDRFWWPPDEGQFAHFADRQLHGEIPGKDFEDNHPGAVNIINAAALKIFGESLVSLRYPLAAMALAQSLLIFFTLAPVSLLAAVTAAIASVALGLINFLNPTHHWYAAFTALSAACYVMSTTSKAQRRVLLSGSLAGIVFLFQQTAGVFLSMGLIGYLIYEKDEGRKQRAVLGRIILAAFALFLVWYINRISNGLGLFLFGLWPLIILFLLIYKIKTSDKNVISSIGQFTAGVVLVVLPMVLYHLTTGSLGGWLEQITSRASSTLGWEYLRYHRYSDLIVGGINNIVEMKGPAGLANGFYWIILPCIGMLNGLLTIFHLTRKEKDKSFLALPFVAVFYGVISLFNQIPVYLYFTAAFTTVSFIWIVARKHQRLLSPVVGAVLLLCAIDVYYHAGQPILRNYIRGERVALVSSSAAIGRLGLWVSPEDLRAYTELVEVLREKTRPGETIFVLPNDSELYFLTDRKNPFGFFTTDHGIQTPEDFEAVINHIKVNPPCLVVYDSGSQRNTQYSIWVMEAVKKQYSFYKRIGAFDIYLAGPDNTGR